MAYLKSVFKGAKVGDFVKRQDGAKGVYVGKIEHGCSGTILFGVVFDPTDISYYTNKGRLARFEEQGIYLNITPDDEVRCGYNIVKVINR